MPARITSLDMSAINRIGVNSQPVLFEMVDVAREIHAEIYETAPRTTKHAYSYRDHFRIDYTRTSLDEGYKVFVIAERFQWRFIEYGWKEWRDDIEHKGHLTMTKALLKQEIK